MLGKKNKIRRQKMTLTEWGGKEHEVKEGSEFNKEK